MKDEFLARTTIRRAGFNHVDFLNWCDAEDLPPERGTYKDVLRYQADIKSGRWSKGNRKLSGDWANERADEACSYLRWMASRGYRGEFTVTTKIVKVPSPHDPKKTELRELRTGREKSSYDPTHVLDLPTQIDVDDWLANVALHRGFSKALACRAVVELATRLNETCAIPVQAWPTEATIAEARSRGKKTVRIMITDTKGSRPRAIDFDIQYASLVSKRSFPCALTRPV